VLSASLLLTGCSGDADSPDSSEEPTGQASGSTSAASASSSPSASSSASPGTDVEASAEPAAEQPPAVPKAKRGKAGQRRFAQHVMATWAYALRTNDAKPLVSLSPKGDACAGCDAFAAEMGKRRKQGWSVDFPGLAVRQVRLRAQETAAGVPVTYARARVDIPESDSFNADGSYRNTSAAHDDARFEVVMRFTGERYRLLAFTVS
jgi:hypothetical protein